MDELIVREVHGLRDPRSSPGAERGTCSPGICCRLGYYQPFLPQCEVPCKDPWKSHFAIWIRLTTSETWWRSALTVERFHPHIIGCRVVVEAPHRSAEGHNPPIGISVEVDVPARPRIIAKDAERNAR